MIKKGVVYCSTGSHYRVKSEGQFYDCRIKGKFRIQGIKSTNPVAVGDKVTFQIESGAGVITAIEPRQNYIVRKSVNLSKQIHIIASNIDQVFLMITLKTPPTFPAFIDRFLVAAEAYDINTVLVFNKIDLYSAEELEEMRALKSVYQKIGYNCHEVVSTDLSTLGAIQEKMAGKVSMFSGHSGVGKSTLVNTLAPSLDLKTSRISIHHQQGQHTTTFAEMFDLEAEAKIIDTPGIKGFGVVDIEKEELSGYFVEFSVLKENCKFNNCRHTSEPQCAIKTALEQGEIAPSRYKSYLQLLEDDPLYR
ncbi:MAG: ribosome small subunit-dependent GTPase A [Flavobacteriaceae bacterium]|jgi:ribosome biogenesis GTPase|nr:ribosome small subunit-dependent GTPase A [Flavobacteriaceae bacterium]